MKDGNTLKTIAMIALMLIVIAIPFILDWWAHREKDGKP